MIEPTMSAERPILFNGAMVRAILDGRKTETRRVVKLPEGQQYRRMEGVTCGQRGFGAQQVGGGGFFKSPYGSPGDLLHVGESLVNVRGIAHYERGRSWKHV